MPDHERTHTATPTRPYAVPAILVPTPGQTIGPFYHYALPYEGGEFLVAPGTPGAVQLHGTVTDGAGAGLQDALLEIWQCDPSGRPVQRQGSLRRDGHTFTGFGRVSTRRDGHYAFTTLEPGSSAPRRARFIAVTVFARGLLNRLFTRIYLPEDAEALAADPLLRSLPEDRRSTLVATREADGSLRFDIRLQGDDETVFLRFPRQEL